MRADLHWHSLSPCPPTKSMPCSESTVGSDAEKEKRWQRRRDSSWRDQGKRPPKQGRSSLILYVTVPPTHQLIGGEGENFDELVVVTLRRKFAARGISPRGSTRTVTGNVEEEDADRLDLADLVGQVLAVALRTGETRAVARANSVPSGPTRPAWPGRVDDGRKWLENEATPWLAARCAWAPVLLLRHRCVENDVCVWAPGHPSPPETTCDASKLLFESTRTRRHFKHVYDVGIARTSKTRQQQKKRARPWLLYLKDAGTRSPFRTLVLNYRVSPPKKGELPADFSPFSSW